MKNALDDVVLKDLKYVVVEYCIMVIDLDSINPLILSLPATKTQNQQFNWNLIISFEIKWILKMDWVSEHNMKMIFTCFVLRSNSLRRYVSCGSVCWRSKYSATCLDGNSVSHT